MTELKKRLRSSYALEVLCAEIYENLSKLFPESSELWDSLMKDEEKHAEVLMQGYALESRGMMPEELVYPSLAAIKEAVLSAKAMREKLGKGEISSLDEALEMSLSLEESGIEGYLTDVLSKETDSRVIAYFRDIVEAEKSHVQKLKEAISARA